MLIISYLFFLYVYHLHILLKDSISDFIYCLGLFFSLCIHHEKNNDFVKIQSFVLISNNQYILKIWKKRFNFVTSLVLLTCVFGLLYLVQLFINCVYRCKKCSGHKTGHNKKYNDYIFLFLSVSICLFIQLIFIYAWTFSL